MQESSSQAGMENGDLRIDPARMLPVIKSVICQSTREVECSKEIMRVCVLWIGPQRGFQHFNIFCTAGKNVIGRKSRGSGEIIRTRLSEFFTAVAAKIRDHRMLLRRESAGFAFVRNRSWIAARQDCESRGIKPKPDVLRCHVQHALGIVSKVMQVRFASLFEQKVLLRPTSQPFL